MNITTTETVLSSLGIAVCNTLEGLCGAGLASSCVTEHEVKSAGSVLQALALARLGGIDIVISDLGLPDGHGHDLMRELRREFGLPGIVLSGYGMENDIEQSKEAGFEEHITKPCRSFQSRTRDAADHRGAGGCDVIDIPFTWEAVVSNLSVARGN